MVMFAYVFSPFVRMVRRLAHMILISLSSFFRSFWDGGAWLVCVHCMDSLCIELYKHTIVGFSCLVMETCICNIYFGRITNEALGFSAQAGTILGVCAIVGQIIGWCLC